jgi:hypothetical protein
MTMSVNGSYDAPLLSSMDSSSDNNVMMSESTRFGPEIVVARDGAPSPRPAAPDDVGSRERVVPARFRGQQRSRKGRLRNMSGMPQVLSVGHTPEYTHPLAEFDASTGPAPGPGASSRALQHSSRASTQRQPENCIGDNIHRNSDKNSDSEDYTNSRGISSAGSRPIDDNDDGEWQAEVGLLHADHHTPFSAQDATLPMLDHDTPRSMDTDSIGGVVRREQHKRTRIWQAMTQRREKQGSTCCVGCSVCLGIAAIIGIIFFVVLLEECRAVDYLTLETHVFQVPQPPLAQAWNMDVSMRRGAVTLGSAASKMHTGERGVALTVFKHTRSSSDASDVKVVYHNTSMSTSLAVEGHLGGLTSSLSCWSADGVVALAPHISGMNELDVHSDDSTFIRNMSEVLIQQARISSGDSILAHSFSVMNASMVAAGGISMHELDIGGRVSLEAHGGGGIHIGTLVTTQSAVLGSIPQLSAITSSGSVNITVSGGYVGSVAVELAGVGSINVAGSAVVVQKQTAHTFHGTVAAEHNRNQRNGTIYVGATNGNVNLVFE